MERKERRQSSRFNLLDDDKKQELQAVFQLSRTLNDNQVHFAGLNPQLRTRATELHQIKQYEETKDHSTKFIESTL